MVVEHSDPRLAGIGYTALKQHVVSSGTAAAAEVRHASSKIAVITIANKHGVDLESLLASLPDDASFGPSTQPTNNSTFQPAQRYRPIPFDGDSDKPWTTSELPNDDAPDLVFRRRPERSSAAPRPMGKAHGFRRRPERPDPLAPAQTRHPIMLPERSPTSTLAQYAAPESILEQLTPIEGSTVPRVRLLRSTWLLERAAAIGRMALESDEQRRRLVLPRRQDLEEASPEAFYSAEEVARLPRGCAHPTQPDEIIKGTEDLLHVVSVSYAWESREHPDPYGRTLLMLADAIERAQTVKILASVPQNKRTYKLLPSEVAVFIDWCSLCQKDAQGERGEEEQASFGAALSKMQIWYAHRSTTCFLMTKHAEGVADDTLEYGARGWPSFERAVSLVAKAQSEDTWPLVVDVGAGGAVAQRPVPISPDGFTELLRSKTFTNGADCEIVSDLYAQTYEACLGGAETLEFCNVGWGDDELKELCESVLPVCRSAVFIDLSYNDFSGNGLKLLAAVLATKDMLPELKTVQIYGYFRGEEADVKAGKGAVRSACDDRGVSAYLAGRAVPLT